MRIQSRNFLVDVAAVGVNRNLPRQQVAVDSQLSLREQFIDTLF
jgi:hypothetical protein